MLHVFAVNGGDMLTFEVNLAMERVLELKRTISETHGIAAEKQVLLISGGQALSDNERVCSYAGGTETNPVYLFDKACIEQETIQTPSSYQETSNFIESIKDAQTLTPSFKTVDVRTKLAIRLHDATRRQVSQMKSLVNDEHLMFQGWQAAVANLADTLRGFHSRVEAMCGQCEVLLQQGQNNSKVLEGMGSVLKSLETIPVLPALLKSGKSSFGPEGFQVSLLQWIKAQCKDVSLQAICNECQQKQEYLNPEHYQSLLKECKKVNSQAADTRMSEISGINERLAALDNLVSAAEHHAKEQAGIAQGFIRNRDTARNLHSNSSSIDALLTLCESHITQLRIMAEYETSTKDAFHKCTHAKNELIANLHTRLRWLYFVQRSILNADVKLSMFIQQLTLQQRQIEFLDQVKQAPNLYASSLAEVVRRKQFASLYVQWANKAVAEARVERDREIVKRKTFQSNISGHFIQKLFHGLSDKPPSLSKKPLRTFDNNLPDVSPEQLLTLSQMLPDFKDILETSSMSTISMTSMGVTQSSSIMSATNSTSNVQSMQHMDSSIGSPPNLRSSSMDTSSKDRRRESSTGSFALVDPSNINQTQPGGFVVTSLENVKQANFEENIVVASEHSLPRRAYSTNTLTSEQQSSPQSSPTDGIFGQIGNIISPDSPPDSEFFSILPGSLGSNRGPRERMDTELSTPRSSLPQDLAESFDSPDGKTPDSSRKLSPPHVGSLDSNSSTSYQKVDDLSSDEDMFHSFTDQQDMKILRKKIHQLQSANEASEAGKEELNVLVRKQRMEISSLKESRIVMEAEFEKRWGESKLELDNVYKQLESERLERKKAWADGANLEKKLKMMEEELHARQVQFETVQADLSAKNSTIETLEKAIRDSKDNAASDIAEAENRLKDVTHAKENEVQAYKAMLSKKEKEEALSRAELSTAEDRIQELETMLSDHERKLEEDAVRFQTCDAKLHELSTKLNVAQESQQQSSNEVSGALQKVSEVEQKLTRANQQIASLKKLLADYETKLNDDKNKDSLLKNLQASLHQLELEKLEISCCLESAKKDAENLKEELAKSESNVQTLKSVSMQDAASHQEEMEKSRLSHLQEIKSLSQKHILQVSAFDEKHGKNLQDLNQEKELILLEKEGAWEARMEELKCAHRNEVDELEADRLACIAASQQTIEELREKLRENGRFLEQERKDTLAKKNSMAEECRRLEEEHSRCLQESEVLRSNITEVEENLLAAQNEIRSLREVEKQDFAIAANPLLESILTSSTDEEMESKRSKMDSGVSDMADSIQSMSSSSSFGSMSLEDHNKAIGAMRRNFEQDKKSIAMMYKKKEEDAAKRRQMIFNSAIQRVRTSKDAEIQKLRDQLMAQSQMPEIAVNQSMMVSTHQPMAVSMTHQPVSVPSPPSVFEIEQASMSSSPQEQRSGRSSSRDRDRAAVTNFQVGDTVLVCYNDAYQHFTLLTTSRTLHFIHHESLEKLGISASNPESKKTMTFATLKEKEYCQARKAQNRFHVPVNTKFYRVKVAPFSKKDLQA